MDQSPRDPVAAEEYADFEGYVREKLDHLVESVDEIKVDAARHRAAIEELTKVHPLSVRRAVHQAAQAAELRMTTKGTG